MGNYIKKLLNVLRNLSNNEPKMVQHYWKINLWSRLGALWAHSWRQDSPRVVPRARVDEKYSTLGWPMGCKMNPKSIKHLMENILDFCNDFEGTFSRSCIDFGSKNLSKMRVSGAFFQPCYEYVKSVIWNNPPIVLLYFSTLKASIFDLKRCIFQLFFRSRF